MTGKNKVVAEQKITKDMLIGEAVANYPTVAGVLMGAGVHCVGCGGAYMETIEEGLKGHGLSDEEVESIIDELNESIPEEFGEKEKIVVTAPAVEKLKHILKQQQAKSGAGLRIAVEAGGCSGLQYAMMLDTPTDKDVVVDIDGVRLMVDKESFEQIKGAKVDYIDSLQGAGFKITNPNAVHSCGCGQSFH